MKFWLKKINNNLKSVIHAPKNLTFRAMGIPLMPRYLVYMITDRCNSRCLHCKIWQQETVDDFLTADDIEKILSDPLFRNVEYILGTGGEPVVRNDIKDIMLAMHRALPQATLQLSTNGLLPDRVIDVVNTLMEHNVNLQIGVSLDGVGETHDHLRGVKGNFEKTNSLLGELLRLKKKYNSKLNVAAGIVVSDITVDHIEKVREYAMDMGVHLQEQWYNMAVFYNDRAYNSNRILKQKLVNIVKSQTASPLQERWLRWINNKSIKFPCFAINNFCVLKCNGDIVPCLTKWDAKIGNVRDTSPSEVWNSNEAKKVRKMVRNCSGCLNSWGLGWSFQIAGYLTPLYYLRHPILSLKKMRHHGKIH